jgi:hypothetical protein
LTTIEEVRVALADACQSIEGWRAQPYIRDQVSAPEIQVARGAIVYDVAMGHDNAGFEFRLTAYVARDNEVAAQRMMQNLCEPAGPGSLKKVLEADETLRALVDIIRVQTASEDGSVVVGAIAYLFVEFTVEVSY